MKLLGAMLLMLSAAMYCRSYSSALTKQAEEYMSCSALLEKLALGLWDGGETLEEAFTSARKSTRGKCGELLDRLIQSMSLLGEQSLEELWRDCWSCMELPGGALDDIYALGAILGGFDAGLQREKLMDCSRDLRAAGSSLRSELRQKIKLRWAVAMSISAMAAITLI